VRPDLEAPELAEHTARLGDRRTTASATTAATPQCPLRVIAYTFAAMACGDGGRGSGVSDRTGSSTGAVGHTFDEHEQDGDDEDRDARENPVPTIVTVPITCARRHPRRARSTAAAGRT